MNVNITPSEAYSILQAMREKVTDPEELIALQAGMQALASIELEQIAKYTLADRLNELRRDAYCKYAKQTENGMCEGLGTSETDDEPPEMCKKCERHYLNTEGEG